MAGEWSTIAILMTCINIFMYIGLGTQGNFLFEGDIMSQVIDMDINKTEATFLTPGSSQQFNLTSNVSTVPPRNPLTSIPGVSVVAAFIDGLDRVYDFVKFILNVIFAPITLFKVQGIPFFITMLMMPLSFLYIISLMQLIRGAT